MYSLLIDSVYASGKNGMTYIILFSLFYANERHANELICTFKQFENKMIYVRPFYLKH